PAGNTGISNTDSETENTDDSGTDQPGGYSVTFTLEGMEERVPADLYIGAGYGILIPSEGWYMYRSGAWMADVNDEVQLIIQDYGEKTIEQVIEYLVSIGYSVTEEDTAKLSWNRRELMTTIELIEHMDSEETKTWGIICRYPPEAEEGFKERLAIMADSFCIMPNAGMAAGAASEPRLWQSMSKIAYGMPDMREFWEAYLAGDRDALKEYLAEDFEGDPDIFPNGTDGHDAEKAELLAVKWEKIQGRAIGDISICSLEILPGEDESLEYLTIALILEEEGWKVSWYGLEK
ncbi:MAG: nuclear transport factor 2 family protein, partial [Acetatifactor sp.]|nr:nuclear transport factor 2 family protein [Acetatifactor sp.]